MTIDQPTSKPPWLARFLERLLSGTHQLVRNLKLQMRSDELVVRGSTDSYHAVQVAISTINALMTSERLALRVRLLLRVNGWPLEVVIANSRSDAGHVTHRRRCERPLTP